MLTLEEEAELRLVWKQLDPTTRISWRDYWLEGQIAKGLKHKQRYDTSVSSLTAPRDKLDRPELKEFTAWAIDTQSIEGHGLLGRYYFDNRMRKPPSLEGCIVALFTTRKIARQYCKTVYGGNEWKPKVIKVRVIIQDDSHDRRYRGDNLPRMY